MSKTPLKLAFGCVSIVGLQPDAVQTLLDAAEKLGIKEIDSAAHYGDDEALLGEVDAKSRFILGNQVPGVFGPKLSTKETVVESGKTSLQRMNTDNVDIFYQHAPDPRVPLEETLAGVNELYKADKFKRFRLSNFTAEGVEEVIRVAKEHGYVGPTVYQGCYNAFGRRIEQELFPVLRKHNISFHAYNPTAGGLFAKTTAWLRDTPTGRWDPTTPYGKMYHATYVAKPSIMDGLDEWHETAKAEGITGIEMANRWIAHHSILDAALGDAVIVGGRNVEQTEDTVASINKGPLSKEAVERIEAIWEKIGPDTPLDNYNSYANTIFS